MTAHHARTHAFPEVPSHHETAPLTAAGIALNIANRRGELLADSPVVEAAAHGYLAFSQVAAGRTPQILRNRSAEYAKAQRSGTKALAYEDLIGMALAGDADSKRALLALLSPILDRLDADSSGSGMSVGEAVADFARESGDVSDALMRGKATAAIYREVIEAAESLKRCKNALRARVGFEPSVIEGRVS